MRRMCWHCPNSQYWADTHRREAVPQREDREDSWKPHLPPCPLAHKLHSTAAVAGTQAQLTSIHPQSNSSRQPGKWKRRWQETQLRNRTALLGPPSRGAVAQPANGCSCRRPVTSCSCCNVRWSGIPMGLPPPWRLSAGESARRSPDPSLASPDTRGQRPMQSQRPDAHARVAVVSVRGPTGNGRAMSGCSRFATLLRRAQRSPGSWQVVGRHCTRSSPHTWRIFAGMLLSWLCLVSLANGAGLLAARRMLNENACRPRLASTTDSCPESNPWPVQNMPLSYEAYGPTLFCCPELAGPSGAGDGQVSCGSPRLLHLPSFSKAAPHSVPSIHPPSKPCWRIERLATGVARRRLPALRAGCRLRRELRRCTRHPQREGRDSPVASQHRWQALELSR
jgi:hypothetical protein